MPQDIQIQRSLTNTPSTLLFGELSWTDNSNRLYIGNSSGTPTLFNTLQNSYNATTTGRITTNSTIGSLKVQRGSAADSDIIFRLEDGTGLEHFTVAGNGVTRIKRDVNEPCLFLEPNTGITDPNINVGSPRFYIESDRTTNTDAFRAFFNDGGTPNFSGYINFGYNGNSPQFTMLDMDDDPCHIDFSIARVGLANPGTYLAPAIVSRFGGRGPFGGGLTGFSWQSNGGVSGGALVEIMAVDSNFLSIPSRTTANRPTPVNGMIGYNTTLNKIEAYENGVWTQYIDTTSNQTIAGNKIFTGKVQANNDVQQIFDATSVTTSSSAFGIITGLTLTTTSSIISTYRLTANLNIRNTTNAATVVEIQVFVNGVADPDTLINYSMNTNATRVFVPIEKIYVNAAVGTTFDIRWRRVSGTATPTITTKSLILQELI